MFILKIAGILARIKNYEKLIARGVSLFDQIMFSAGNFILTIMLARYFSDISVAAYGVGLSVGLMLQNIFWTTYVIKNSVMPAKKFLGRADKVMGEHLVFLLIVLAIEILAGIVLVIFWPGEWSHVIIASIIVCTLIYLQLDFERIVCLKYKKTGALFWSSAIFFMMNAALFFAVPRFHVPYIAVMGLIALFSVGKITHLVASVGKPDFSWGWRMAKYDVRKQIVSSLLGASGGFGYFHMPVFLMTKFAAPLESAAFIALRGLMQPAMIIIRSLDVIDKNLFNPKSHSNKDVRHAFLRQIPMYVCIALGTISVATLLGHPLLSFFYGERYSAFYPLLLGWAIIFSLMMVTPPIDTIVVKMGRVRQFNYIRMGAGIVGAAVSLILCPMYGAQGAICVTIVGCAFILCGGIWLIRDVLFHRAPQSGILEGKRE